LMDISQKDINKVNNLMINYEILEENIVYFPEVVDNLDEILDLIENTSGAAVSEWKTWYAESDTHVYGEKKFMRRFDLNQETDEDMKNKSERLIESLSEHMCNCFKKYSEIYSIDEEDLKYAMHIINHSGTLFSINKYNEGRHMGPHVDFNEVNNQIRFVIAIYFNDDHEGGELHFKNHDITIKPKAGSIIMFPTKLPYLHESLEITNGRKMIMTHHWADRPDNVTVDKII
jgi:hypothetical protein